MTQMGNHGHSNEGTRRLCEYIWAGAIGQVREVHCWTTRCNGLMSSHNSPALPLPRVLIGRAGSDRPPSVNFTTTCIHTTGICGKTSATVPSATRAVISSTPPTGRSNCKLLWRLSLKMCNGGDEGVWPIRTRIRWDFRHAEIWLL